MKKISSCRYKKYGRHTWSIKKWKKGMKTARYYCIVCGKVRYMGK